MSKIILGYYGGWDTYNGFDIANIPNNYSHLTYAFLAPDVNGNIVLLDTWGDIQKPFTSNGDTNPLQQGYLGGNLHQLFRYKKLHPGVKTGLAIGGFNNSTNFSTVAGNSTKRTTFANSVKTNVMNFGVDYIDIDWENMIASDVPNLILLLQKIKLVSPNLKIILSLSVSSINLIGANFSQINSSVSYFNIMAIDFCGSWSTDGTLVSANLYGINPGDLSGSLLVSQLISFGIPSTKILLECPMYASPSGVSSSGNNWNYNSTFLLNQEGLGSVTDPVRISQISHDPNGVQISYDNGNTIVSKCNFITANNLAGICFWEISGDRSGTGNFGSLSLSAGSTLTKDTSLGSLSFLSSIYKNIKNSSLA